MEYQNDFRRKMKGLTKSIYVKKKKLLPPYNASNAQIFMPVIF